MSEQELPQVQGSFGQKPKLVFSGQQAPAELEVSVIKEGDGQVVEEGDYIACNYLGQVWDGNVFDNSYDRGQALSFQVGVGQVIAGWDSALVGLKVGTRVLLSIPPELGYGERGVPQAGIKGGDTLVFVPDVLGIL